MLANEGQKGVKGEAENHNEGGGVNNRRMRHNEQEQGRVDKHSSNTGRLMKFEMAKETEGQRRQEVKDRQLVKGRGGRILE